MSDKGLDQQQPTYVCTLKSQTNLCYLVHKRMQPFCLALNRKAADKGWKKAAGICAVPVVDYQMKTWAELLNAWLALTIG